MDTKLTDLNVDCLEHILELLSFRDLLNVADSNKILNSVAFTVISRRYSKQNLVLILEGSQLHLNGVLPGIQAGCGLIRVTNFLLALKILRNFSRACVRMIINYRYMTMIQKKNIEYYLGEYSCNCDSSFQTITLENCPNTALNCIETPLQSVEKVFITGDCKMDFEQLNKKMPNMNSLILSWVQTSNPMCIERKFPALKHFQIEVRDRLKYFTENNVLKAIQMNPQLIDIYVKLYKHPELNEEVLANFFKKNFHAASKTKYMIESPEIVDFF